MRDGEVHTDSLIREFWYTGAKKSLAQETWYFACVNSMMKSMACLCILSVEWRLATLIVRSSGSMSMLYGIST